MMKYAGSRIASRLWALAFPLFPFAGAFAQTDLEIQNLRAFVKLYGYVKYFHPSDEAYAVPWDAFAVYGAERVRGAADQNELEATLESLFSPIAPTIQIFSSSGETPPPLDMVPDDISGLDLVVWQHRGVSFGMNTTSPVYQSARLNRRNPVPGAGQTIGNVIRAVEAAPYLGERVRLKAYVRADVIGSMNRAQLWLRVDREGNQSGFFDNMGDRPITANEWQQYEIVGEIADDATNIVFGCFLAGKGTMWLDDVELEVTNELGEWVQVEFGNAGFEEADENGLPSQWSTRSRGYEYALEETGRHQGERSLVVRSGPGDEDFITGDLFEVRPAPGEIFEKELGAGLVARVPLALYSNGNGTLGDVDEAALEALMAELQAVNLDTATADALPVRLGAVTIAWNVFQHFYPYFDVVGTDWNTELTTALAGALGDESAEDFFFTLNAMVASLHDGHGNVYHDVLSRMAGLPFLVDWVEGEVVVSTVSDTDLMPGDVIATVDGESAEQVLTESEKYISGSPQWMRVRALRQFCYGVAGTEVALEIQRGDSTFETRITRERPQNPIEERTGPSIKEIESGVFYVDLDRAPMAEISERMKEIANARGVVFDLRGYPTGNHAVIGHLLEHNDTSDAWMRVPQAIYPDRDHLVGFENHGWGITPLEPHITGEVVFLTDGRAISYAESFMSFIEHYRLAEIVGQPTAGANGNVNPFRLPGGFRVFWTGMKVVKHDGSQHHTIGILPTIPMRRTIQGIRERRDELLEKALQVIKERTEGVSSGGLTP